MVDMSNDPNAYLWSEAERLAKLPAQKEDTTMTFDGRPVKAVRITATIEMVSFVFADYPGDVITWEHGEGIPDTKTPLSQRIAGEIQDALDYRSHHLEDSEDGDGLIAPYETPTVVGITVADAPEVTGVDVERIAEGMGGEL